LAAQGAPHFADETQSVAHELAIRVRALAALAGWAVRPTSETPINGPLGPNRRFDFLTMDLDDVKAVRKALGCTVNDVVLATVAGAVREFLIRRRVRPDEIDFRISAPVNIRQDEEKGRLGNRVSSWIVRLPVGEADPLKRLEALHEVTRELKASKQAIGVAMMMELAEWTPTLLISLGARAVSSPVNMIVTNVPGPQFPLYLLGAKMLGLFPVVPLLEGTGLAVGLFSYNGVVFWGFNADYGLVPDLAAFRRVLVASFRELQQAAGLCVEGADIEEGHSDPKDA